MPAAEPKKSRLRVCRSGHETSQDARAMLFGLYKDACAEQGWSASDAAQRQEVTREALDLGDNQDVPSWSSLDKNQITALKEHLGILGYNLAATISDKQALAKRQALWSIEASARAMCTLGPVHSDATDTDWNRYILFVLGSLTHGTRDSWRTLPLASPDYVDLPNIANLLHNRFYAAARRARAAGQIHTHSLKAWVKQAKQHAMDHAAQDQRIAILTPSARNDRTERQPPTASVADTKNL